MPTNPATGPVWPATVGRHDVLAAAITITMGLLMVGNRQTSLSQIGPKPARVVSPVDAVRSHLISGRPEQCSATVASFTSG